MRGALACLAPALLTGMLLVPALRPAPADAQGLLNFRDGDQPIEITAEEGIEWRKKEQVYVASGNARASRGDLELFGDILSAYYRPRADGSTEIHRVEAHGNVRIVSPNETITGDDGFYDVEEGLLMLTGENLRLEAGEEVITARDSLEYRQRQQLAVARGDAVAVRGDKRLEAEVLTGHFERNAAGELTLVKVNGEGGVSVSTPSEFVRSDTGVYYLDRDLAELRGNVKITREDAQLNGEYAEINLATGVSRLLAAAPEGGDDTRVHGLVLPAPKKPLPDDDS